jgi:hypothetical protein
MIAQPKFSKPSKMPCRSWSLQALETCPASKDSDGELVPACKGCYATSGNYRFPNVKAPREHNKEDWQAPDWVDVMVSELDNHKTSPQDSGSYAANAVGKALVTY